MAAKGSRLNLQAHAARSGGQRGGNAKGHGKVLRIAMPRGEAHDQWHAEIAKQTLNGLPQRFLTLRGGRAS